MPYYFYQIDKIWYNVINQSIQGVFYMDEIDYSYSQDREKSWLQFNERVLKEANDFEVPLMERLRFMAIYESNLQEFFRVRVGSLHDMMASDPIHHDSRSGLTPQQQLSDVLKRVKKLTSSQTKIYNDLNQELILRDIQICKAGDLKQKDLKFLETYFTDTVAPLLTPIVLSPLHPFPHLENGNTYLAVLLDRAKESSYGLVPLNPKFAPVIFLPGNSLRLILVEDLLELFAGQIFNHYQVKSTSLIRVTRSADIDPDEADEDYREAMKKLIKKRRRLEVVRLESNKPINEKVYNFLKPNLKINDDSFFITNVPFNWKFIGEINAKLQIKLQENFNYKPFRPYQSAMFDFNAPITPQVMHSDKLLSFPYESMEPYINLLKESARDPETISIKITIYRLAKEAKIVKYLAEAAENGVDVLVLMELRARFDEENNINYSQVLEDAGCKIIYGFEGYKVHSKITLITKKKGNNVSYITQIGTGNYNESTSRVYTDLSLITTDSDICLDAVNFFNNMTLNELYGEYSSLLVAPNNLRESLIGEIESQTMIAQNGGTGYIYMKMNSLTDRTIIDALAVASQAGVKIELVIRGICCIVPGIPDKTDNITIKSIVGRFLEHSRIYSFGLNEQNKMYIGSSDMMTRNTMRRVEICAPIKDDSIKARIQEIIDLTMADNVKGSYLQPNGKYVKIVKDGKLVNSQEILLEKAKMNAQIAQNQINNNHNRKSSSGLMDFFKNMFNKKID